MAYLYIGIHNSMVNINLIAKYIQESETIVFQVQSKMKKKERIYWIKVGKS